MNQPLFKLVTKPKHVFPESPKTLPPNPELGRHSQSERFCSRCGAAKITVHPEKVAAYRMWRKVAEALQTREQPACEVYEAENAEAIAS